MSIKEEIRNRMYAAMKSGNKENKLVYSTVLDNIQKAEKTALKEFSDDEVIPVIQKQIKQCKETLEYAEKANNKNTINSIKNEIVLLSEFLPKMMDESEIKEYITNLSNDIPLVKANKGKLMKNLSILRNRADMRLVSQIVDSMLV